MLRDHHTRELPLAIRSGSTRQALVLGRVRLSSILSFIWVLFESSFFGPHVVGLRFDGAISLAMWGSHVLLGIWISYWLVFILTLSQFCFNSKKNDWFL